MARGAASGVTDLRPTTPSLRTRHRFLPQTPQTEDPGGRHSQNEEEGDIPRTTGDGCGLSRLDGEPDGHDRALFCAPWNAL